MLKPLIDSNREWKNTLQESLRRQHVKKRYRPAIVVTIMLASFFIALVAPSFLLPFVFLKTTSHYVDSGSDYETIVDVNPVTNTIYTANRTSLTVIDGVSNKVIGNITLGQNNITNLAVNPATNMIYVANYYKTTSLTTIDGVSNKVIGNITLGQNDIYNLAVNPATNMIYAAASHSPNIILISGKTNEVIGNIDLGQFGQEYISSLAVNPATNMIYVASNNPSNNSAYYSPDIVRIKGATNKILGKIDSCWKLF